MDAQSDMAFTPLMQLNIWSYSSHKLVHSIETGHSANIFCTKFIPETSDELVVSGAGDAEVMFQLWLSHVRALTPAQFLSCVFHVDVVCALQVRLFNLSRLKGGVEESGITPSALFQCHTRRVKKLTVNPFFWLFK